MVRRYLQSKDIERVTMELFDRDEQAEVASSIIQGILEAKSPRICSICHAIEGRKFAANYKAIQRFLEKTDVRKALNRLYMEQGAFVIGDPTDIERPEGRRTAYVGYLKNGKRGFQLLTFSVPFRGRALPFHFITYSSKTIEEEGSSRNLEHRRALRDTKELVGTIPVVLDREFSYEGLMSDFIEEGMNFVIRLNTSKKPTITDEKGNKIELELTVGKKVFLKGVYYKGKVRVNIAGEWRRGFKEPLWVIATIEPEEALKIYKARVKIEESFKDMKDILGMGKIMSKKQENMEKMLALLMLAYVIGYLVGEEIRDRSYTGNKWRNYSGLFVLLKQRVELGGEKLREGINKAITFIRSVILGIPVLCVRT
jgi:hypothetical protein